MSLFEPIKFFIRYVRNPSSIGAVCPSSRFLARKMARPAKDIVDGNSVVVEFGSGTGAVTKFILSELSIAPKNLYCVEFDSDNAKILSQKFANVSIANDSAENIEAILGANIGNLKCIISSLPLLSLPEDCVRSILSKAEDALPEGGIFVQFTYNWGGSVARKYFKKMNLVKSDFTLMNIPPARIDIFQKNS